MKTKILLLFFIFSFLNVKGQTVVLDNTFADQGVGVYPTAFYPKNVLFIEGSYYSLSSNMMAKTLYNGQPDTTFGTNSYLAIGTAAEANSITDFKYINGYFYLFGKRTTNTNDDIFIAKLDTSGNYDTSFGAGGKMQIDLGKQETVSDILINPDNSILCIGTRYGGNESSKLLLLKLNANGTLDTSFNAIGYKEFLVGDFTYGASLYNQPNGILLVGTTFGYVGTNASQKLLLINVTADGTIITSESNNGMRSIQLQNGGTITISQTQLVGNKLFVNYFFIGSTYNQASTFLQYDLDANQTIYNRPNFFSSYMKAQADGLYFIGFNRCSDPYFCYNDYEIVKWNALGNLDTSFNNTGSYRFSMSRLAMASSDDRGYVLYVHDDGKIMAGGKTYIPAPMPPYTSGFLMIRIQEGTLGIEEPIKNDRLETYPNPFTDNITIKSDATIKNIEIFDLFGRSILKSHYTSPATSLDIDLGSITQKGMYILKAEFSNDKTILQKIIKN